MECVKRLYTVFWCLFSAVHGSWGILTASSARNGMRVLESSALLSKETTEVHGEKCDGVHRVRNNQNFAQCQETTSIPWSFIPQHYPSNSIQGINLNKYKLLKCIVSLSTSVKCQHSLGFQALCVDGEAAAKRKCGPLARQQQLLINLENKRGKKNS